MLKKLASLLILLAVVATIAGGIRWRGAGTSIGALNRDRAGLQTQLDTTRTSLHRVSLRYRGFQQGMQSIPDSLRKAQAGESMNQDRIYRKTLMNLEGEERRLTIAIKKIDRKIDTVVAARRQAARPFAIAVTVLVVAAGVLFATGRRRRVAS